jgi:DNA-binding MarR family transcriptional regulator
MTTDPKIIIGKYQKFVESEGEALVRLLDFVLTEAARETLIKFNSKSKIQLTPPQSKLMQMLCFNGMKGTDLAERLGVTKQAVGQTLRELETIGLIQKDTDSTDSRARIIKHTKKGIAVVALLVDVTMKLEQQQAVKIGKTRYREMKMVLTDMLKSFS